jgi:hypothetical protein
VIFLIYLLDANVLIDANRDYYPLQRVPEFWEWLENTGENGNAKIPLEVYEEISDGKDELAIWAKQEHIKTALLVQEEVDVSLVSRATDQGYASDLTDDEVEKIGRDPFLIAYALRNPASRCVVTTEVSKPRSLRANRHLPDVCADLGVRCCNTFEFLRALDFTTRWNSP